MFKIRNEYVKKEEPNMLKNKMNIFKMRSEYI